MIKTNSKLFVFITGLIVTLPTFYRMLRPGLFSMQDFHFFRLVEFGKCIKDLQIPCRWAPDSAYGYGEPLFNFYGQLAYLPGEILHLIGFSQVDSLKGIFIISLLFSFIFMYMLARQLWKNDWSALLSATIYVYAPYRAVDVWVRGALPEAFSFVLFPLIIFLLERFFNSRKLTDLALFSLSLAILVCTHNLSTFMFLVFLIPWISYRVITLKDIKLGIVIFTASIFSLLLASYYILPVIFESKYISFDATTTGYFDFRGHYVELRQLLIDRNWGYGGSVFGAEDGLSLSVGQLQWILPLVISFLFFLKKKINKEFFVILLIGWISLFLTHNKSTVLWESFPLFKYVQFPWRFLSIATFCFSLSSGALILALNRWKKQLTLSLCLLVAIVNFQFFHEDLWLNVNDSSYTSGKLWQEQQQASIGDYWPVFGYEKPSDYVPKSLPNVALESKNSWSQTYKIENFSVGNAVFPLTYFPGWKIQQSDQILDTKPKGSLGLVSADSIKGGGAKLIFTNTQVRDIGNKLTLISLLACLLALITPWFTKRSIKL